MNAEPTFTDYVELHERKWGEYQYVGRPSLTQLLNAPIVVIWRSGKRFKMSVYQSSIELGNDLKLVVFGQVEEPKSIYKVFCNRDEYSFNFEVTLINKSKERQTIANPIPEHQKLPINDKRDYPRVIEGAKYGEWAPGRNEPNKPGRNAPVIRTKPEDYWK